MKTILMRILNMSFNKQQGMVVKMKCYRKHLEISVMFENKLRFKVINDEGQEVACDILLTFDSEETH